MARRRRNKKGPEDAFGLIIGTTVIFITFGYILNYLANRPPQQSQFTFHTDMPSYTSGQTIMITVDSFPPSTSGDNLDLNIIAAGRPASAPIGTATGATPAHYTATCPSASDLGLSPMNNVSATLQLQDVTQNIFSNQVSQIWTLT